MLRRWWSPQVAKGFLLTYMVLALLAGGALWLREGSQGKRLTTVEQHVVVLERAKLCSTRQVCRHLLDNLLADATRPQATFIRTRLVKLEDGVARRIARAHRRAERRKGHRKRHPAAAPALEAPRPLEPIAVPARPTPAVIPAVPPTHRPLPVPPKLPEVHAGHGPPVLPCVKVAHIEVACHGPSGPDR